MTCCHSLVAGFWLLVSAAFFSLCAADPPDSIEIHARPLNGFDQRDPSRSDFGDLEYRGGLVLSSPNKHFGGISALRVRPDGSNFLGATDRGFWLRGRIVYDGNRPTGIADVEMKPILDAHGKPSGRLDVESIAADGNTLYAGVERINSILRFDYGSLGFLAPGKPIAVPAAIKKWPGNQSLEAIVFVPRKYPLGGTLIVLSEYGLDESGNAQSFLIGGPMPGMFAVKRSDSFDISDAALSPSGDILLLDRKYSVQNRASMRIRRVPLEEVKPGALLDGTVLIEADRNFQIDNMEAIGVHRASSGEIIITLMSDDNFSSAQRTIMLQFALME
jgi:hypothetical protein